MSAYICNPEQFGLLGAYAALKDVAVRELCYDIVKGKTIENAQRIAINLARENIRSVKHRYPDDKDGNRPGPCLLDDEIEEAAALYAAHFFVNPIYVMGLKSVTILKLSQCVDYQSCETNDWKDTLAYRQLERINYKAISDLPGYESADWSYERSLPDIEILYKRHQS